MVEYAKLKNTELDALLKQRDLPTSGKKADKVERLTQDDEKKKKGDGSTDVPAKTTVLHPEDEIDWDDDADDVASAKPAATSSTKPTNEAAAAVERAGGKGLADNPQAVPNQVADIDPSKTADLSVKSPGEQENDGDKAKAEESKEPPPDYTRGLAASNLDEEIEKRKARAKKFGLNIEEDEGLKKLERAKKFGETGPPKGLDEALPERSRKRGRDENDESSRGGDKRRGSRFGGRRGRGLGDRRRDDGDGRRDARRDDTSRTNHGNSSWMNDADRAKAEARKSKWAKPTTS